MSTVRPASESARGGRPARDGRATPPGAKSREVVVRQGQPVVRHVVHDHQQSTDAKRAGEVGDAADRVGRMGERFNRHDEIGAARQDAARVVVVRPQVEIGMRQRRHAASPRARHERAVSG